MLVLASLAIMASCGKKVEVAFSSASVEMAPEGGVVEVALTSNGDWSVDTHPEWIAVSPNAGTGDAKLTLTASANEGSESRTGEITVSSKDNSATLTVTQGVRAVYLTLSPTEISCGEGGGAFSVAVVSNCDWTVGEMPSWLHCDLESGSGNGDMVLTVDAMTDDMAVDREGQVVVAGGEVSAALTVVQYADPIEEFEVTPVELHFESQGGTLSVSVVATVAWTVTKEADWITLGTTEGTGDMEVSVEAAANEAYEARMTHLNFDSSNGFHVTVEVSQEAAENPHFLEVTPQELSFAYQGGTMDVSIGCDTDWEVTNFQPEWASLSAIAGTGTGTLTLAVEPNTISEPRSFSFNIVSGTLTQRILVSQEAGVEPPMVSLTPDTLSVSYTGGIGINLNVTANVSWELQPSAPWIILSGNTGDGDATVGVVVDLNSSELERQGSIRAFYNGQLMDETIVVQEGRPNILETDITEINAGAAGGEYLIQLTANQSWNVEKGASWLTVDPLSGTGDGQLVVKIESLMSPIPRTAEIYIRGSLGRTVIVTVNQSN